MNTIKGRKVTVTTWSETKKQFGYPDADNNGGYEHGFEFVPDEDGFVPMEAQWFLSESDMYTFMNRNELKALRSVVTT